MMLGRETRRPCSDRRLTCEEICSPSVHAVTSIPKTDTGWVLRTCLAARLAGRLSATGRLWVAGRSCQRQSAGSLLANRSPWAAGWWRCAGLQKNEICITMGRRTPGRATQWTCTRRTGRQRCVRGSRMGTMKGQQPLMLLAPRVSLTRSWDVDCLSATLLEEVSIPKAPALLWAPSITLTLDSGSATCCCWSWPLSCLPPFQSF